MEEEKGWLIEMKDNGNGRGIAYGTFATGDGSFRWTNDSLEATRFCRKEDAEWMIDYLGYISEHVSATEHIWS